MNYYSIQQNGVVYGEDMFIPVHHARRQALVCPKPRRVGATHVPLRHLSNPAELSDGSELLEILLAKGGRNDSERSGSIAVSTQVGLSPPFFCGSPPSRVSNPLIKDARFRDSEIHSPVSSVYPPSSPARKGGCVRPNFGNSPVVRVEGFDCLDRDRSRNCRIPALA